MVAIIQVGTRRYFNFARSGKKKKTKKKKQTLTETETNEPCA